MLSTDSILAGTPMVEGVLIAGPADTRNIGGCRRAVRCDALRDTASGTRYCTGELATKITHVVAWQPAASPQPAGLPPELRQVLSGLFAVPIDHP